MESKKALDKIIKKSRVHFYKPIQLAEILYHNRTESKIKLDDIESYRNISKKWRDDISKRLVGRVSTSSQKFQDNLFDKNAMPPQLLKELGEINNKESGIVENYIYNKLKERLAMISNIIEYINRSGIESFALDILLSKFTQEPGLKRSVDKIYEIITYALFNTIVRVLKIEVSMGIKNTDREEVENFSEFVTSILGISKGKTSATVPARIFRMGRTNAADRGLDILTNFGTVIQVKHLSLSEELAEEITDNISADRIILICLDGEKELIEKIINQTSFGNRIHGIITFSVLNEWYKMCFSKKYKNILGKQILEDLVMEFNNEFPTSSEIGNFLQERKYDKSVLKTKNQFHTFTAKK